MPVKKTVAKKPATKTASKEVNSKVAETKKPTVIVETKKTDRCECGDNCNCGDSCNCGCKCDCGLKILILVLLVANLVISGFLLCKSSRSAWDLEALKVWGDQNLQKLSDELYSSEDYIQAQKESIEDYLQQLWIN